MHAARVLVVVALLTASGAPASAAKPKPPTVAAQTLVFGYETAVVDVTVPKGVSLVARPPQGRVVAGFADFLGDAEWSAVGIVARGARTGGMPLNAVQVHLKAPDHCPSATAPTVTPPPPCKKVVEHSFVNVPGAVAAGGTVRYPLPAGTYQIVVSGPPRTFVNALLTFAGVKGLTAVFAGKRAAAAFQRTRVADLAFAHATGSFSHRFTGRGLGVVGLWHTAAADEPGEFTYAECVTPGAAPGPADPDDCVPLALTGQPRPDALGPEPAWFAGSVGGFTLTSWGTGTWETPILPAGTYTNSFRLTRGGRGPAAGAFAWWVQIDSLK